MSQTLSQGVRSAWSTVADAVPAAADLAEQFRGLDARVIVFFASPQHDGVALSGALRLRFPEAQVVGCSTAGEFTEHAFSVGGVSALALTGEKVLKCAVAFVKGGGASLPQAREAVSNAAAEVARGLGTPLRELDPKRHVGVILHDGLHGEEERINEALGDAAPLLTFVGASAGDNLAFQKTELFINGSARSDGALLLLMELAVPFVVSKTASFVSRAGPFRVTRANAEQRIIYALDGVPITDFYVKATGLPVESIDATVFRTAPLGLMFDGVPFIRSPQTFLPDGGLRFFCGVREGMEVNLMQSTDLLKDTRASFEEAKAALGGTVRGGLAFNCILRRLDLDAFGTHEAFLASFEKTPLAGFHTYGESYIGHVNQTLTALWMA